MNPSDITITTLDSLLSSDFRTFLPEVFQHESKIQEALNNNRHKFEQKIAQLGNPDQPDEVIASKIKEIESDISGFLSLDSLTTRESLSKTVADFYKTLTFLEEDGLFLSEKSCSSLLSKCPPTNLNSLPLEVLKSLSSIEKISITRHTENKEWQTKYLSLLNDLPGSCFEKRNVSFLAIDSSTLKSVMSASDMKQKPWRISHAKETGTGNLFTHDSTQNRGNAPLLQFISVLFHYYFETIFTGQLLYKRHQEGEAAGSVVGSIIKTGNDKFDFFHPNAYSEHLYWTIAVEEMCKYLETKVDMSFFVDTLYCGEFLELGENPTSLNLIDHIWNANILTGSKERDYFQFSEDFFLYHFREGLWYEILRSIVKMSEQKFAEFIKNNLDKGDKTLTTELLSKA